MKKSYRLNKYNLTFYLGEELSERFNKSIRGHNKSAILRKLVQTYLDMTLTNNNNSARELFLNNEYQLTKVKEGGEYRKKLDLIKRKRAINHNPFL